MRPIFLLSLLLVIALVAPGRPGSETRLLRKATRIHAAAYTLDSHTDTPLLLTWGGFDFGERHEPGASRSKVDLPRMKEGGLDGIYFAAFIVQGKRTPKGNLKAKEEAMKICDSIHATVRRYSGNLEIATKAGDLKRIARQGKHAIYLGLENGYPLGNEIQLVDDFYKKGIRYITLVHTVNNDICDSSTDTLEHGGLSPFGEDVVRRMNELGIMVDISHASDDSFYDVIELSSAPVIASHSCARALCDNPRNLSDDLLLKLKTNGGVIQMCILSSYVKTPGPDPQKDSARYVLQGRGTVNEQFPRKLAYVTDVVDHIDHIVKVAGIDHVGIGTDFDGGGEVTDCYDVSEMGNITLELVRRGYSAREIRKIWGGNLTRVLREVEMVSIKNLE